MDDFDPMESPKVKARVKDLEAAVQRAEKYPLCTRLSNTQRERSVLNEFFEFLDENKFLLCEEDDDGNYPIRMTREQLLMKFFDIDPNLLEKERRKLLAEQRALNERKT